MSFNPYESPRTSSAKASSGGLRARALTIALALTYICTVFFSFATYSVLRWAGDAAWLQDQPLGRIWNAAFVEGYITRYPNVYLLPCLGTVAYGICLWRGDWRYRVLSSIAGIPGVLWLFTVVF